MINIDGDSSMTLLFGKLIITKILCDDDDDSSQKNRFQNVSKYIKLNTKWMSENVFDSLNLINDQLPKLLNMNIYNWLCPISNLFFTITLMVN